MTVLEPTYTKRTEAYAKLREATQTLTQAQSSAGDELERVRDCERRLDAARDRPAFDAARAALNSAQADHVLAVKRLTDRQGEHAHADMEARAAEAMVVRAVDQILSDEIAERAKQVAHHLDEARRLGSSLQYFAIASGIHATSIVPQSTLRVLERLHLPLIDSLHIPIDLAQLGDTEAFRDWTARRNAMLDGETAPKAA